MGETSQRKIRNNPEASSKVETLSIIDAAQKFFRDRTATLNAACNHMNALLKQLQSKKLPQCAWSIRRDVGQDLFLQKIFLASATVHFWLVGSSSSQLSHTFRVFSNFSRIEVLLEISAKTFLTSLCNGAKDFTFIKLPYLYCFHGHVIFGQRFTTLLRLWKFSLSFYHLSCWVAD